MSYDKYTVSVYIDMQYSTQIVFIQPKICIVARGRKDKNSDKRG